MKLELKHLAPYLPYGLKNQRNFYKPKKIEGIVGNKVYFGESTLFINQIKPILRPLSDLVKSEWKSKIFKLQEIQEVVALLFTKCNYTETSVWEYEFLLKNHFDVFGLIEKGLAIDINTL